MITASKIVEYALAIGYDKCGIIGVSAMKGYAEKLKERIDRFPEVKGNSEWLYSFADLERKFPWGKSIIICASWYGNYHIPKNVKGHIAKYYLTDSRRDNNSKEYKRSIDFEKYLQDQDLKLATDKEFGLTALRWAAMQAKIGIIRKNNFLYTEKGSWVNLEAFLIDTPMEYINHNNIKQCPENCSLCIKSCPTESLSEPYTMCRNSCISCLTTWDGWDLTTDPYSVSMGKWIFGCDICQDICPFNKNSWTEREDFPNLNELCKRLSLSQIVEADYLFLRDVLQPKLWYIPQEKIWRYKTNALNVMLNDFKPEYLRTIKVAITDENKHVRKMAKWVLAQLDSK